MEVFVMMLAEDQNIYLMNNIFKGLVKMSESTSALLLTKKAEFIIQLNFSSSFLSTIILLVD